jgi:hypothetical protein
MKDVESLLKITYNRVQIYIKGLGWPVDNKYTKPLPFVVVFIVTGTVLILISHAATPYASTTADTGALANGAVEQTCSGATDGNCVVFAGSSAGPNLHLSGTTITWTAIAGSTGYKGATSNGASTDTSRTTTYSELGNVTTWSPASDCGNTDYYGVAAELTTGDQWSVPEVSITWPACSSGGSDGGSNMVVGLNAGGWGASGAQDVAAAVNYVRLDQASGATTVSDIGYYTGDNVKADIDYSGDLTNGSNYDTGGVSAINASNWSSDALSWYESNCNTAECPMIEVLNEPYGSWFWGSSADDQTNADAYGDLVEATYNAFHTKYGSNGPKILANTFANGCANGNAVGCSDPWWGWLKSHDPTIANYYDGVIMHAYGDTSDPTLSAEGNRNAVTSAYDATGKPVYVTEVGWPTDIGSNSSPSSVNETGDSYQWSLTGQCNNIYNFITWTRGTNYVNAVFYFNYADYGTNDFYGIETHTQSHKPSYNALKDAAKNLSNPC